MMTYWRLAACVALTAFCVAAALLSMMVAALGPWMARRTERVEPSSRAALLLAMRVLPAAGAALVAFGIALPVFLWFEPRDTDEAMARTLLLAGVAGLLLLARGAWRGVRAWRATRAVARDWQQRGRRVSLGAPMPVFAIDGPLPTVAVVGFSRPALFIAEHVLRDCTAAEIEAIVCHETAHVTARDNWKRLIIRVCPDVLRGGAALERAWCAAVEQAADAAAVATRPSIAIDLAQALIRVARLAPMTALPDSVSAFYRGGSIEARVRRLVDPPAVHEGVRASGCLLMCTMVAVLGALAVLTISGAPTVQQFLEAAIKHLP